MAQRWSLCANSKASAGEMKTQQDFSVGECKICSLEQGICVQVSKFAAHCKFLGVQFFYRKQRIYFSSLDQKQILKSFEKSVFKAIGVYQIKQNLFEGKLKERTKIVVIFTKYEPPQYETFLIYICHLHTLRI